MNRVVKSRLRSRVVVTLKSGESFTGVLFEADRQAWVLREAEVINGVRNGNLPLDGEVVLLVSEIAYAQRP